MRQETKIQLLPVEIEMVSNADFILTKNAIMQKIYDFLFAFTDIQKKILIKYPAAVPEMVKRVAIKISKGENYKGLPWLVLDHPRYFEKNNVFAVRTMFWWGNFFSTTLHLSGKNKEQFQDKILKKKASLDQQGFYVCINQNEWEHHFQPDNYKKISACSEIEFEKAITSKPFLKIASEIPLRQINEMEEMLFRSYEALIRLVD